MLSAWFSSSKKNTTKMPEATASYIEENDPAISFLTRRQAQKMVLNVNDFKTCFEQALKDCGGTANVTELCQPNRLFTFNFDEPTLGGTVFEGLSSDGPKLEGKEADLEHAWAVALRKWFNEHPKVCEQTLAIALRLLKARKATDQALTEEPEEITQDMFALWSIFEKKTEGKKQVQSHTIFSMDPSQPELLNITAADFYTSMAQAIAEVDQPTIDVDSFIHANALYTFAFGNTTLSDVDNPATFNAITSTVGGHDDHIIDAKWLDLHNCFVANPGVLQRTFKIAKELVEERASTAAALEDEGELVEREEVE